MSRYLTRTAYWDESVGEILQPEAMVTERDDLTDTGLLDASGERIYRTEKITLGFDLTPRPRVRVKAITRRV